MRKRRRKGKKKKKKERREREEKKEKTAMKLHGVKVQGVNLKGGARDELEKRREKVEWRVREEK